MSAIRDLIGTLRSRPGIDAAVVVGHDGLVIDADAQAPIDPERVAAHLPALRAAADRAGASVDHGALAMLVLEHERGGLAVVSVLTNDVMLLVLLAPDADSGALLGDLRRERARFASLV